MAIEWFKGHLNVPLNAKGVQDYDDWADNSDDIFTVEISEEYDLLFEIFYDWNRAFWILIDMFEEDTLDAENLARAEEIFQHHIETDRLPEFLAAAAKLKLALDKALEVHMPLHLDF